MTTQTVRGLIRQGRFAAGLAAVSAQTGISLPAIDFGIPLKANRDLFTDGRRPLNDDPASYRRCVKALARAASMLGASAELGALRLAVEFAFGRYDSALAQADAVVSRAPDWSWAYLWRFRCRSYLLTRQRAARLCRPTSPLTPDYRAAIADSMTAQRLDGSNPEIYVWRAELHSSFDDYEAALQDMNRAIELAPDYEFAYAVRAEILTDLGRQNEAELDATFLVERHPREEWTYAFRGRDRGKGGRFEEALIDLHRAVALSPKISELHAWLGEAARRRGIYEEASGHLHRARRLDARNEHAWRWLGRVATALGRPRQGLTYLNRAARLDPRLDETFFMLTCEANIKAGLFEQAAQDLDRVYPSTPSDTWSPLIESNRRVPGSTPRSALRLSLDEAVRRAPRSAWPLFLRGRITGSPADFDASLQLAPRQPWARLWRALAGGGDAGDAAAWAKKAKPRYGPFWGWSGVLSLRHGDAAGAQESLSRALDLGPGFSWLYVARARARLALGLRQEALADLDEALLRGPKLTDWFLARGRLRRSLEMPREALEDFKNARLFLRHSPPQARKKASGSGWLHSLLA